MKKERKGKKKGPRKAPRFNWGRKRKQSVIGIIYTLWITFFFLTYGLVFEMLGNSKNLWD